jgi:Dyp-type peroxidase family
VVTLGQQKSGKGTMSTRLRLDNIQGNVTPGFRSSHQAFMFVRFPGRPAATAWLGELQPEIASAQEVATFLLERRQESARTSATWANVAFSWLGLECLGAPSLDAFPDEFRSGMYGRAARLGDDHRTVAEWEVGGSPETEAHGMLVLAAGSREDLERAVERQTDRLASLEIGHGAVRSYVGQRLPEEMRGREHFGFMDGVSQPGLDIAGETSELDNHIDVVKPGEFILGYPDDHGETRAQPAWTRDGSYASFRRLRQNVALFRQIVGREAEMLGLSPQQLGAKLVGRWPSGAKLGGEPRDPGENKDLDLRDARNVLLTEADFADDRGGERTPRFAHIRKAYPRDETASDPLRHRLLRRGIPYGDPLPPAVMEDDGQDRGLLFLAYQASLARQFEHLQERWFNNPDFPRAGDGPDPLIGQPPGPHELKLRHEGGGVSTLRLDRFVSVTAGGYFFAPSIRALAYLAGRSAQWNEEDNMAYQGNSDLGDLIFDENPYGQGSGQLRPGFQSVCEIDDEAHQWDFNGERRRVRKALRIPYRYRDGDGYVRTEHLLIGYEGGGGN